MQPETGTKNGFQIATATSRKHFAICDLGIVCDVKDSRSSGSLLSCSQGKSRRDKIILLSDAGEEKHGMIRKAEGKTVWYRFYLTAKLILLTIKEFPSNRDEDVREGKERTRDYYDRS